MPQRIAINSQIETNQHTTETINGRDHIVVNMRPIRGDTTMNGIFYPLSEVKNSFEQLNNKPAPNGHPQVNNQNISAFHPLAVNAHNIGAFVRNPKMNGKQVITELVVDVEVANKVDDGKELVKRIKNKEPVGVSTGLIINLIEDAHGSDDYGHEYNVIGRSYEFDHVAILLNEKAAGAHAGTELMITNAVDDRTNKPSIKPKEVNNMDKEKLVLAIIGNKQTAFIGDDKDRLMSMSESDLITLLVANVEAPKVEATVDEAKTIMVNSGFDLEDYDKYVANKAGYETYLAEQETKRKELVDSIVKNSDYTEDLLKGKPADELEIICNMLKKADRLPTGNSEPASEQQLDFNFTY